MLCVSSVAGLVQDKAYAKADTCEHRIGGREGMFPYTGQDGVRYSAYVSMYKDTILPGMVTLSARVEGVFVVSSSAFHGEPGVTDSPGSCFAMAVQVRSPPYPTPNFPGHRTGCSRRFDGRCLSQPQGHPKL